MPDPLSDTVRIWYVSAQRLCNFKCSYCVSIGDYAKSNSTDWLGEDDQEHFHRIVDWIARRPFRVGVRLATLGEPFASRDFLDRAAWLTKQPNVDFIELLTNGSLLKRRLEQLDQDGDIRKVSLWVTHHHTQISVQRFIDNALFAQEMYGCFVVVNALLFPDNEPEVLNLKSAAEAAGLRFNVDLGYDPLTPHGKLTELETMVPLIRDRANDGIRRAVALGADPELIRLNLSALRNLRDEQCSAGHNYFYIGIRGDAFRCSRYQTLGKNRLGNVLDDDFELSLNAEEWSPCAAGFGCGNKEDFLHLRSRRRDADEDPAPSLGWVGPFAPPPQLGAIREDEKARA